MLFHSPQASQRPDHFVVTLPQAEQEYEVVDFAMVQLLPEGKERDKAEEEMTGTNSERSTQNVNR